MEFVYLREGKTRISQMSLPYLNPRRGIFDCVAEKFGFEKSRRFDKKGA